MSVLNQSGEEQVECPLCMEPLEVDDLNFFPCTCGYQICRFCWHRIRLDENGGLCPACRKAYSENPADFIPLSREQVAKLKAEKKQRIQQRKAQQSESRKHLASVRVVQRNLVFVVGLPPRLADPEVLKRHEYFGKFGKIHKVVINQSTSYAGSQGPSASAYVTYLKSDDALRAIQAVNNVTIDNRVIKSSLGTTKYCSHFMKNQPCPKGDCMYLHEYGDPEASFTREQMHLGKHQEYEKKLHEDLVARSKTPSSGESKVAAPAASQKAGSTAATTGAANNNGTAAKEGTNKETWPQLDKDKKPEKGRKGKTKNGGDRGKKEGKGSGSESRSSQDSRTTSTSSTGSSQQISTSSCSKNDGKDTDTYPSPELSSEPSPSCSPPLQRSTTPSDTSTVTNGSSTSFSGKLPAISLVGKPEDSNSYFSSSGFALDGVAAHNKASEDEGRPGTDSERVRPMSEALQDEHGHQVLTDVLPNINTTEDWAAAFGFAATQSREQELLQLKLQQQQRYLSLEANEAFGKGRDSLSGFYEMSKFQENLMDALAHKTNGYHVRPQPEQPHLSNGLEQNMSKFFSEFHKYNSKQEPPSLSPYQNGYNSIHNPYQQILQQKQLEEQFRNLGLKQHNNFSGAQTTVYQNGILPTPYTNGEVSSLMNGSLHSCAYSKPQGMSPSTSVAAAAQTNHSRNSSEAELDFDPFQETQKALAEMMATEQNHKSHTRPGHVNGLMHGQNGAHIPPPPPGFVQQQQTHMNSFGSKILPFLSMSNSQQQINIQLNNSPPVSNNWPSSSLSSQIQQQQQKNLSSTCNDWKVLDPAILRSSQSFQLPQQMTPSAPYQQQQQINHQPPNGLNLRSFDYPVSNGGAFSAFAQQLQPNFNGFAPAAAQSNLNWFAANDVNAQISTPPGFRNGQTSKQQEC